MKLFLFCVLITLLLSANAAYAHEHIKEWFECNNKDDCIKTYDCMDVAVNKLYLEQFNASVVCSAAIPPNPDAVTKCINNQCTIVIPDKQK